MNFDQLPQDIRNEIFKPMIRRNASKKIAKFITDKIYCSTYQKNREIIASLYFDLLIITNNPGLLNQILNNGEYRKNLNKNPQLFYDTILEAYELDVYNDIFVIDSNDLKIFFSMFINNITDAFNNFCLILIIAFVVQTLLMV